MTVVPNVAVAGAKLFSKIAKRSVDERGRFVVNLSGGSTPLRMYEILLSQDDLPWEATWVTWGDERFVPHESKESNYGLAKRLLLEKVQIPPNQILSWPWNPKLTAPETAQIFEDLLTDTFGNPPIFDLTFLGLGEDAHTASLFPGSKAIFEQGLTSAVKTAQLGWRLTMTPRALNSSLTVAFLVSGKSKLEALRNTMSGEGTSNSFPARAITACDQQLIITDQVC